MGMAPPPPQQQQQQQQHQHQQHQQQQQQHHQQQQQTAKRNRSNTSNEFINSTTPQTTAPALRHAHSSIDASLYTTTAAAAHAHAHHAHAHTPAIFQQSSLHQHQHQHQHQHTHPQHQHGAFSAAFTTARQPTAVDYAAYQTLDPSANGFAQASFAATPPPTYIEAFDPRAQPAYTTATYSPAHVPNGYTQSPANGAHTPSYLHLGPGQPSDAPDPVAFSSPQTLPATPVIQHHGLPAQYGETYTSQPAAHTAMYQPNAVSYPGPTVNPQYSPAAALPIRTTDPAGQHVSESPPHGHHHAEDARAAVADEAVEENPSPPGPSLGYDPSYISAQPEDGNASTHADDEAPRPPESKCACKKGRGKKKACTSCACSKYGRRCGKHCSCGVACANPFQDLTAFFGPSIKFPKPCDANACFATWLSNQPNIEELDVDLMVDMLLYDDNSWATIKANTKTFKDWEDRWMKAKNSKSKKVKETRERLEFELLRGALGNCNADDFHGFNYSFCRGQWVPMDLWEHCRECRSCAPSSEWHCEQHGRCTSNRICPGCAGDMAPYVAMGDYSVTA